MSDGDGQHDDPILLTPGPLTTSSTVKQRMLRDWGSRDEEFIGITARVRQQIRDLAGCGDDFTCVPLQGSGTFAVEGMLGTLMPTHGKLLVAVNGAYGRRMVQICEHIGREVTSIETAEHVPVDPSAIESALEADERISHVAIVHCETTTGILNPVEEVASVVEKHDRRLLVDAMSAFGAIPLDGRRVRFDAMAASSNKCLEGVPGVGYVLCRVEALEAAAGNCHSLSLDLTAQWKGLEANGQWRFTPPTHVMAALAQALEEHAEEGGIAGRGARYGRNCKQLVAGMREMGFVPLLPAELQAPIIVTFLSPADPAYRFDAFYEGIRKRGFAIYPGKLTTADTFRVGCIGQVHEPDIRGALEAIRASLADLGVASGAPAPTTSPG